MFIYASYFQKTPRAYGVSSRTNGYEVRGCGFDPTVNVEIILRTRQFSKNWLVLVDWEKFIETLP